MQWKRKDVKKKKKEEEVQGCLVHIFSLWPPSRTLQNFTIMELCFYISVGEDVMFTYLCVLITKQAARLTDWDDYLTMCTINVCFSNPFC